MSGFSKLLMLLSLLIFSGCAGIRGRAPVAAISNPVIVPASNMEAAWEQTIDVLHEFHFEIERENRQARTIETKYRVGSGLLEPWHKDSVGWNNRLESTLQSVRRKVVVTLFPTAVENRQAYGVQVIVLKEWEDLDAIAANSPGGATFQESSPLQRDLSPVLGQSRPSGWIPQGRDADLERVLLNRIQGSF